MNELEKLLEEQIKKLRTLKQNLELNREIEKSEEYNIEIIETINEAIDCISLPLNKLKKKLEENSPEIEQGIEEKYRFITENVNDVISVFDKNLNLIYINDAVQRLSGFSKEEVLGRKSQEFMHPDDISRTIKIFQEALKTGEGFGEFRLRCKDGSYVWLEANAKIINDGNGKTKAILVSRDITKRKLMENELKKSEEKYRLITENINDLTVVLNQNFECEYINEQVSMKIWGYNKPDLMGKSILKLIHPDDLKIAASSLRKGFKNGEGEAILRAKKKDGNYAWFEIRGKGFTDEKGVGRGLLISRDITKRKQAEERYRQLFENSPFSIILLDQQGIIIDCNSACEKLTGYKKEEDIMNILLNAVKNTPPNGKIYINMKKYNGYVDILIRDTGVGLTEEEKSKLFKKFGKIERYGKGLDVDTEGSGLGLYISKKIVELHGGKVWAESEGRNKGSAFIIRLPEIS